MMSDIFIYLLLLSIPLGQLARISLPWSNVNLYLGDVFLMAGIISGFLSQRKAMVAKLSLPVVERGLIFSLVAFLSLVASIRLFSLAEVLVGSLYLARFLAYFCLFPLLIGTERHKKDLFYRVLVFSGFLVALGGWIQLVIFPDLGPLVPYGWDPHYYRLVSTLLDPNFTGAVLVFALLLWTREYLNGSIRSLVFWGGALFLYASIVYTFSRSAYLMFLASFIALGYLKSWRIGLIALLAFVLSLRVNPRVEERLVGAVSIDASAGHRVTSWKRSLFIFKRHPILGVGFNNFRAAQLRLGFIDPQDPSLGGHGGAGVDSGFLFVLATTGAMGGISFTYFLFGVFKELISSAKSSLGSLVALAALFGLLFHTQFVNSLFYPSIMVFLFSSLGLAIEPVNLNE